MLGLTRAGVWVLLLLAAANGLFLYLVPGRAETDYGWSITPTVNAAFIGAGFLAGTLATGLVLRFATRWRSFALLPPALWVLAASLLALPVLHSGDVAGGGAWSALMTALLALALYGLRVGWPERDRL